MTVDGRPALSVVVAATDSPRAVDRVLGALDGQDLGRTEVLVVAGFEAEGPATPCNVRWIVAPPGSGVPRLRRIGLEAARGRAVVFTEDSCVAAPGWLDAWLSAFDDPSMVAASGVVEHPAGASTVDWAIVFCEYAPFLPPTPPGPPSRLAGNNFAATREVALRSSTIEIHETALLAEVLRLGGRGQTVEGARVRHVRRFGLRRAIVDRLRFGLEYGRLRAANLDRPARLVGPIVGPAIFAAQAIRMTRTVLRNRRHFEPFVDALPITLALLLAWSVGEWAGWCLGTADRLIDRLTSACSARR